MHLVAVILTFLAALCCGLIAGLFFAFSNFVMKALASVAPERGMSSMQAINRTVLNPVFLCVFLGTAVILRGDLRCCAGSRARAGCSWAACSISRARCW